MLKWTRKVGQASLPDVEAATVRARGRTKVRLESLTYSLLLVVAALSASAGTGLAVAEPSGPAEHATHGEAEEGGGLNPLSWQEIKGDLAIWTAAVFLVLLLILWKFAWGPLAEGLDKRQQGIASQIAQAEEANQQAKTLLAQYEQRLADAREEVRGIVEQGRRDAEQLGRELLEKAKTESEAERQRVLRQIDSATTAALKELADRSATLAVELAGRIVGAQLKPGDHARLIEKSVAEFARAAPSEN